MVYRSGRYVESEERKRDERWLNAVRDATDTAESRYRQLATALALHPQVARLFVVAAFEVARYYHEQCTYANYERRAGHPYPAEGHLPDEDAAERAWDAAVAQLTACLAQ